MFLFGVICKDKYVALGSQLFRTTFSSIFKVSSCLLRAYQRIHRPQLEITIWRVMTLFVLGDGNLMRMVRPWLLDILG